MYSASQHVQTKVATTQEGHRVQHRRGNGGEAGWKALPHKA